MGKGDRVSGARLLSLAAQMRTSFSLLPLEGGAPEGAEVGRVKRYSHIQGSQSRLARLPLPEEGARMFFKETLIKSFSFAVKDSRPHMCRAVPLSSSVFHAACALSAPAGHIPLKGKADDTRIPSSKKAAKSPREP